MLLDTRAAMLAEVERLRAENAMLAERNALWRENRELKALRRAEKLARRGGPSARPILVATAQLVPVTIAAPVAPAPPSHPEAPRAPKRRASKRKAPDLGGVEIAGENRLLPMIRGSQALTAQLSGERWDAKRRRVRFQRCSVHLRSARVPSELASLAARWLFGDEAGKWPEWTEREAAPWELALERTRTFWNSKAFLCSTPTTAGT